MRVVGDRGRNRAILQTVSANQSHTDVAGRVVAFQYGNLTQRSLRKRLRYLGLRHPSRVGQYFMRHHLHHRLHVVRVTRKRKGLRRKRTDVHRLAQCVCRVLHRNFPIRINRRTVMVYPMRYPRFQVFPYDQVRPPARCNRTDSGQSINLCRVDGRHLQGRHGRQSTGDSLLDAPSDGALSVDVCQVLVIGAERHTRDACAIGNHALNDGL